LHPLSHCHFGLHALISALDTLCQLTQTAHQRQRSQRLVKTRALSRLLMVPHVPPLKWSSSILQTLIPMALPDPMSPNDIKSQKQRIIDYILKVGAPCVFQIYVSAQVMGYCWCKWNGGSPYTASSNPPILAHKNASACSMKPLG
jgi:hypothetical protein